MSIEPVSIIVSNTKDFSLSNEMTQLMRAFECDAHAEMNFVVEIGEKEFMSIFKN